MIKKYILLIITMCIIVCYMIIQFVLGIDLHKDEAPIIHIDNKSISMSVKDPTSKILEGIKVIDKEDGDITTKVIIEDISGFINDNTRIVNYVVFDSHDNIAKASRNITYTDYSAPVFSLTDQLSGAKYSTTELMNKIKARSSVDGDISNNITVMNVAVEDSSTLNVRLSVSDSTNTTSYLNVNYYLESELEIDISLKRYIVYKKVGEVFDFRENINTVVERLTLDNSLKPYVKIQLPDMSEPGVYEVEYSIKRSNGNRGKTTMIVVVEYE